MVDLEPHRGVDRVLLGDAELGAAEGDAERPVGAAVEAEAGVLALLAHRPHVADAGGGDQQAHAGVAHPEGGQPAELLGQVEAEVGAADHRVDPLGSPQVLGAEQLGGVGGERLAEGVQALGPQLEPGGGAMPAEADQVLGAGLEPGKQVEAGDAAPRAAAAALAVEGDHDRRPVVALDQPRGDDPDHSGMPALAGDDQRRHLAQSLGELTAGRLGRRVDLALGGTPLAIGPAQLLRDLGGPRRVIGQEQLNACVSPVEPPRSIDPRRQFERQVALVETASARIWPLRPAP